jgi:RNase_H superfamily
MTPKIITLDIETSPIQAFTWGLWKQNIGLNQIIKDWSILAYAAKTLGERKVRYMDVADQDDLYDDSLMLHGLWAELDAADIVITQNGKHFDHRKINARLVSMGLPPPSPYKIVDTKIEAAKLAMFTSNKLEWLAAVLTDAPKDAHTAFPGFTLWRECLNGNPKAWAVMRKYNPKDVIATEKLYLRLRPYIVGHPNVTVYDEDETMRCPRCASPKLEKRGFMTTQVGQYQRYSCKGCGGWARSRYTVNTLEKRQSLLSN